MAVSYKRLRRLLVEKEMSKSDLRKKADIAPNTMTKLHRDEDVSIMISEGEHLDETQNRKKHGII